MDEKAKEALYPSHHPYQPSTHDHYRSPSPGPGQSSGAHSPPPGYTPQAPYPTQGRQPPYPTQGLQPGYSTGPDAAYTGNFNQAPPMTTVYVSSAPPGLMYSEDPTPMVCPGCGKRIVTVVNFENGTMAWLVACMMCFVGCAFGCCLIPFCCKSCQDCVHTCPECRNFIGRYKRGGGIYRQY